MAGWLVGKCVGRTQSAATSRWCILGCFDDTENYSKFLINHGKRITARFPYALFRIDGKQIKVYGSKNINNSLKK